jgi:hypothetical protein
MGGTIGTVRKHVSHIELRIQSAQFYRAEQTMNGGNPDQSIASISLRRAENSNRGFWPGLSGHGRGLMGETTRAVAGYCETKNITTNYYGTLMGTAQKRCLPV